MISDVVPSSLVSSLALATISLSKVPVPSTRPLLTESLTSIGRDITSAVCALSAALSFLPNVSRLLGVGRLVASKSTSKPIGGVASSNVAIGASKSRSLLLILLLLLLTLVLLMSVLLLTSVLLLMLSISWAFCMSIAASSRSISSGVII